jgi:hypothetical protein
MNMATQLFETRDRDESHAYLEKILRVGRHPRAECREDPNTGKYSVWDGPEVRIEIPVDPKILLDQAAANILSNAPLLDVLADKLAAKMKGR